MFKKKDIPTWKHPSSYVGHSPGDDYLVYSRCRDSNILENSNYECILEDLKELDPKNKYVYDFRASHWANGWIEHIIIKKNAPSKIINRICEILDALSDYPVLDESDFSEREYNYVCEYWESLSLQEKIDLCKQFNISIFSARKDNPYSIYNGDYLIEWLSNDS